MVRLAAFLGSTALEATARRLAGEAARGQRRLRASGAVHDDPADLARGLRQAVASGTYLPSAQQRLYITKRRGGTRPLDLIPARDQILHAALARWLSDRLDSQFSPASWAFRPGRSHEQAARRAARQVRQGLRFAADVDVHDCFGSIRHDRLLGRCAATWSFDEALVELIGVIVRPAATRPATRRGIAQGSALSPLLANLFLHPIDRRFEGLPGYQRYADDLVVLARGRVEADDAYHQMVDALRAEDLDASGSKSGVHPITPGWRYLGWTIEHDGVLRPPRK